MIKLAENFYPIIRMIIARLSEICAISTPSCEAVEKSTRRWRVPMEEPDSNVGGEGKENHGIRVFVSRSARCAVGFGDSPAVSYSHFIRSHPPRLRDHPGAICLAHRQQRLPRRGVRVSRVSIHPVREKRRFVFLRAGLNLIIGKQARFSTPRVSPPFPSPSSPAPSADPASRLPRVAFFPVIPPPTDVRSHSATSRLNPG